MLQYSDSDFFEFQKIRFDEEDRASYQMHKPQINKELSRSLSSARSSAKGSNCFICKNKCDSFCNSHSVPQFCLRKIADKGKVLQSGLQEEFPLLGDDTGVKKAGIFFLICHNCDNTKFQEYENPQSYNQQISQTILAQIAMKNTLQLISKRKIEYQLYKILEERDSAIAQEITQKEFCQGIFSRCAPSLYITSSWRLLTCTKIENNIKMNRICMTIKACRGGQRAIELNQAD